MKNKLHHLTRLLGPLYRVFDFFNYGAAFVKSTECDYNLYTGYMCRWFLATRHLIF